MVEANVAGRGEAPSSEGEKQRKGNKTVVKGKVTVQQVQQPELQQEVKKKK